jgi:hypothetical protein
MRQNDATSAMGKLNLPGGPPRSLRTIILDSAAQAAPRPDAWAAQRWTWPEFMVPEPAKRQTHHSRPAQHRAGECAATLRAQGVDAVASKVVLQ